MSWPDWVGMAVGLPLLVWVGWTARGPQRGDG